MTIVLVFGCTISGMLCRATPAGEYASAWLEAWEGNDESLQQWKEFRDACKHPVYYRQGQYSSKQAAME